MPLPFLKKKVKSVNETEIHVLLESFYGGGILLNKKYEIVYFNKGSEEIFDYNKDEVIGKHINLFVPPEIHDRHSIYMKGMETIPEFRNKLMGKDRKVFGVKKDKTKFPIEIRLNSLKIKDKDYILIVVNDKTIENNLKQNLEEYKSFFEESVDVFVMIDSNRYFTDVNNTLVKKLGYTREKLLSVPFTDFMHSDDIAPTQVEFENVLDGQKTYHFENRYKTIKGNYIWLSWAAIQTDKCMYATARDVTHEKLILDELEKKDELLSHTERVANVGTWDWNIDNNELYWSDGVKKIFDEYDVSFKNYMKHVHPEDVEYLNGVIKKSIDNKSSYYSKHRIITTGDIIKYIKASGEFMIQNDGTHLRGAVVDITEETIREQQLQLVAEHAKEASFMKSMFVANMSHEIRTPLNGIIGMTNILKEMELNDKTTECIQYINHSSGVLLSIINKVLDFSKIESGKMELHMTNINFPDFIEEIKNHFQILCQQRDLNFIIKNDKNIGHINCDKTKITQILYNLIGNSIKFTSDGMIILDIVKERRNENWGIKIFVKDTGIGIDDHSKKRLFMPFVQGDVTTTKKFGGTGLGLSICKKLVELMDGTIKLESSPGLGTCITFWIPVEFNDIEKINEPIHAIVVAEDNYINQVVIKKILEKMGFEPIVIYEDGVNIVENLREKLVIPDLIFMDIHMPRMNGFDATKEIRKMGIDVPIIALTANAMDGIKDECLAVGMNDILLKPYQKNDLGDMIKKWLV